MKTSKRHCFLLSALLLPVLFFGCSIQKIAVNSTGGIIDNMMEALYEETDLEIAETAIAADIKLLEGLLKTSPENRKFLQRAAEGYFGYALAFAEDQDPERASGFYDRARNYGFRLLETYRPTRGKLDGSVDELTDALKKADRDMVPALFWTANAWASYINLNRDDPSALFGFPKVIAIMSRVLELDERFYFGGPHVFFGTIYASLGIAGGDIKKSKEHFDRALEISDGKFLMTNVFLAQYYAVAELDEELFSSQLQIVMDTPVDILPEYGLLNAVAKKKAALYLSKMDEMFD